MGQKINPNLFQLTKNNKWKSKYFEKIPTEFSVYLKRDQEIRDFIIRFFKIYRLALHNCRLYYFNKSLHIFISYHLNLNCLLYKAKVNKINSKQSFKVRKIKTIVGKNILKYFKSEQFCVANHEISQRLRTQFFLKKLFESLTSFTKKRVKFFLVLKELKLNTKWIIACKKTKRMVKKNITSLRKYKKNAFFKEGINILFNCATNKESSKLLAQFIAMQLKNLKRHNFFIRFIQNTLKLFKNNRFSKFKGIKIEIKGRLNRRPRARNKIVKISNNVSVLTINSIIDYSKEVAFTPNGTLGIKVWIHEF